MKLRPIIESLLTEIGDRILYPRMTAGWGGGKAYFTVDEVDYEIKIKLGNDYEDVPGTIRIPEISFSFNIVGKAEYDQTNKNVPLKVMSYVIGAVDSLPKELFDGSNETNELQFNSIVFSTGDSRKVKLYTAVIGAYAKSKNVRVDVKQVSTDGVFRASFDPVLSFKRQGS